MAGSVSSQLPQRHFVAQRASAQVLGLLFHPLSGQLQIEEISDSLTFNSCFGRSADYIASEVTTWLHVLIGQVGIIDI